MLLPSQRSEACAVKRRWGSRGRANSTTQRTCWPILYFSRRASDTNPDATRTSESNRCRALLALKAALLEQEYSKTYRAKSAEKGLLRYAFEGTSEECRTIWDIATRASKLFADREYFGVRVDGVYKWQTYSQVYQKMLAIGAALRSMGCQRGSSIGIMAPNRPEWVITAFGAYSQTLSVVALYSTLGPNAVEYILNHAELTILFVAKKHLVEILPILSKTKVRHVVQFDVDKEAYGNVKDAVDAKDVDAARQSGVELIGFSTLIQKGIASGLQPDAPGPEDLAYIMYTSGTTGNPKGACLTHVNIISTVAAVETIFKLLDSDVQ
ncbi:hypothetical protein PBRA_005796 [Plasmodiophora brassicae]|uniref:AMP-dependent synthetase/ligase domain-containing protein n=1 Tax=Plasmodiophora brassicae TaxID=37360 RepID=A0A0G4IR66_PLABS|nr:hypothetical protein PBRA_005796 [Plasmodiophora brassicae]